MRLHLHTDRVRLYHGDSANVASVVEPESIDALVCDPPAGIDFMGREWDGDRGGRDHWIAWLAGIMRTAIVLLKPGAHALVWALPRTSHWTATAVEDAGFEIRDVVMHLFGTGFPKSLDVSKAIDSRAASEWSGFGTALKPAAEHWILARKPLAGTVASNVLRFGTGALNVDGCRVGGEPSPSTDRRRGLAPGISVGASGWTTPARPESYNEQRDGEQLGRWPANVALSHLPECNGVCAPGCAVAMLDEQSGPAGSNSLVPGSGSPGLLGWSGGVETHDTRAAGGASRFFYTAKPARSEKDAGLDHLPIRTGGEATDREDDSAGLSNPRAGAGRTGGARNFHPTVKGIDLMRWLCRLITPPGGTVLDLFAGSGTTGLAALREGFRFVGVEQMPIGDDDPPYIDIAAGRLAHVECVRPPARVGADTPCEQPAQPSLFDSLGGH